MAFGFWSFGFHWNCSRSCSRDPATRIHLCGDYYLTETLINPLDAK